MKLRYLVIFVNLVLCCAILASAFVLNANGFRVDGSALLIVACAFMALCLAMIVCFNVYVCLRKKLIIGFLSEDIGSVLKAYEEIVYGSKSVRVNGRAVRYCLESYALGGRIGDMKFLEKFVAEKSPSLYKSALDRFALAHVIGDDKEAELDWFNRAVSVAPKNALLSWDRAFLLLAVGQRDAAVMESLRMKKFNDDMIDLIFIYLWTLLIESGVDMSSDFIDEVVSRRNILSGKLRKKYKSDDAWKKFLIKKKRSHIQLLALAPLIDGAVDKFRSAAL